MGIAGSATRRSGAAGAPGGPTPSGAGQETASGTRSRLGSSRLLAVGLPIAVYVALAIAAYWPVSPLSSSRVVTCGCYDVAEQAWFLAWTPHAILNGLNPFFTHALNAPYGANLAANTSMPLLGILAAPVTLTLGPISAFNLLIRLAFVASATSMFFVARRYTSHWPIAFAAGLLYGFSPYMIAQGSLHLNLVFVPIPPLVLVVVEDLLVSRRHSARRDGLVLGALATAQYFISSELLADLALLCAIGVVVLCATHPRATLERARHVATGLAWALVPFLALTAYPIAYSLFGAQHFRSSIVQQAGNQAIHSDLLSPIVPTPSELIAPSHYATIGAGLIGGVAENGSYLGIPLLAVALGSVAIAWRSRLVRFLGLMALVAFVLSLGPTLVVDGRATAVGLPFRIPAKLSLVAVEVPARYALFAVLVVAVLVTIGLDRLVGLLSSRSPAQGGGGRRVVPGVIAALVAAVALVPLVPRLPYPMAKVRNPSYFSSAAVRAIPAGSTVLAYPYPIEQQNFAMLWQAASGFRFDIIGGYVLTPLQTKAEVPPGAGVGGGDVPPTLNPAMVEVMFEEGFGGVPAGVVPVPQLGWAYAQFRSFFETYRVDTVAVWPIGVDAKMVVDFFHAMLGPPVRHGSMDLWYHVRSTPLPPGS